MTVFITHCLRKSWFNLIKLLACACLVGTPWSSAHAQATTVDIAQFKLERAGDVILLTANVKFDLPSVVEDALLKGVALIFVAEADIFRERWYWMNKKVVNTERHMRLAYQPLTRRWRLNVASGVITNADLGMALNQNFETLSDALAAVQRLSRWKITDASEIDLEQRHIVEFRFRLDTAQLPRPLQIGTLGQTEWNISATSRQTLTPEVSK